MIEKVCPRLIIKSRRTRSVICVSRQPAIILINGLRPLFLLFVCSRNGKAHLRQEIRTGGGGEQIRKDFPGIAWHALLADMLAGQQRRALSMKTLWIPGQKFSHGVGRGTDLSGC